jgi:hypothetical protein
MTAAVITVTPVADAKPCVMGNRDARWFDITADTGTYTTGGFTVTAAQFGFKHVDICIVGSLATMGTSGANALGVGVTYSGTGTSVLFQGYESAATGLPMLEKTNTEAYPANLTFRVMVVGV